MAEPTVICPKGKNEIKLTESLAALRGSSGLPAECRPAVRHIRTLLAQIGIPVDRETPALRLNGNRVYGSFRWEAGEVGAIERISF